MQKQKSLSDFVQEQLFSKILKLRVPRVLFGTKMQISAPKFAHTSNNPLEYCFASPNTSESNKNGCTMTFCKSLISEKILNWGNFKVDFGY
jgi:hypothetical protein